MRLFRKISLIALLFGLALGGAAGCGGGNDVISFSVIPGGPTLLALNDTLQFDTNPTGLLNVTWSVVGGNANGTIDQDGLYTPPSTLPIENVITVEAEREGFTDTGTVDLQASDTLAFSAPEQINDIPVPLGFLLFQVVVTGVNDQIAAGLGSVHAYSSWSTGTLPSTFDVAFTHALDLAPFGSETNLTNNGISLNNSLFIDQNLNPGILFSEGAALGPLNFMGSSNQGNSFNAAVPIVSPPSGNVEFQGTVAVDSSNVYHLVYLEQSAPDAVKYSTSSNGGANWSAPIVVSTPTSSQALPQIAVSPNGQNVFVCYSEDVGGDQDVFFASSTNGGSSFTSTNLTNSVGTTDSFCNLALGPNGEIYVAYSSFIGAAADILFQSSTNGGTSFNPPVTVNSTTAGFQIFSFTSVDDLGRIDIIWSDGTSLGDLVQLMYSRSTDGGATFSANVPIVPTVAGTTEVFGMGLTHDESGRTHIQYLTDVNDPGNNYDIFYLNAE